MDLDFVSVHKHANKELWQYPAILALRLVNNPYSIWFFISKHRVEIALCQWLYLYLLAFLTFYFLTCKYCSTLKKAEGRNVALKARTVRSLLHDASFYTSIHIEARYLFLSFYWMSSFGKPYYSTNYFIYMYECRFQIPRQTPWEQGLCRSARDPLMYLLYTVRQVCNIMFKRPQLAKHFYNYLIKLVLKYCCTNCASFKTILSLI